MPFNFPYDMMFYIHVSYSTDNDDETDDMRNYVWYAMYGSVRTWGISQVSAIWYGTLSVTVSNCWMLGFLCSDIPTWRMGINWSGMLIKLWRITGPINWGDHPWPMPSDRMQNPSWSVSMNSWGIWFIVGFTNRKPLDLEWFIWMVFLWSIECW